jgi:serine/threonine protein phosphatase PrpC
MNPGIPYKRNVLSSKINIGNKVNFIQGNFEKNQSITNPIKEFIIRNNSIKPESRINQQLSDDDRTRYAKSGKSAGIKIIPVSQSIQKIQGFNQMIKPTIGSKPIDNKHLIINNSINFNGVNREKHQSRSKINGYSPINPERILNDNYLHDNNNFKLNSFKIKKSSINELKLPNNSNRVIFSGNAAKIKLGPILKEKYEIKIPLVNSIIINPVSVFEGEKISNDPGIVQSKMKKPSTTSKLEINGLKKKDNNKKCTSIVDYAYKLDQNVNRRKTMEDYIKIVSNFMDSPEKILFCLFDGHGGNDVAESLSNVLPNNLRKTLENQNGNNIEEAITKTFQQTDEIYKSYDSIGSTASLVYIFKNSNSRQLIAANVGDSAIILIDDTCAKKISYDHKCSDPQENERIKRSRGIIFGGRVYGMLAITRSFGDYNLKEYGVYSNPYITTHSIKDNYKYIILVSDGVMDVLDELTIFNMSQLAKDSDELSQEIIKKSIELNTFDNVSCIVAKLN